MTACSSIISILYCPFLFLSGQFPFWSQRPAQVRSPRRARGQCSNASPWCSRRCCCCHQTMKEQSRSSLKQVSCPGLLFEEEFPVHWVKGFFSQCAEQTELGVSKEEPPAADCNPNCVCATAHPIPKHNDLIIDAGPWISRWYFWALGWTPFEVISFLELVPWSIFILLLSCQFQLGQCLWHHFNKKFTLISSCALGLQLADLPEQSKVMNPNNSQYWRCLNV